jgi:hypothetical protein
MTPLVEMLGIKGLSLDRFKAGFARFRSGGLLGHPRQPVQELDSPLKISGDRVPKAASRPLSGHTLFVT